MQNKAIQVKGLKKSYRQLDVLRALNAIPNEQFYELLLSWREQTATKEKVMPTWS